MRRSSISIPSNIAEGHIKKYNKEFSRYLRIALGSCAELKTQAIIAKELEFIDKTDFDKIIKLVDIELKQISALLSKTNN